MRAATFGSGTVTTGLHSVFSNLTSIGLVVLAVLAAFAIVAVLASRKGNQR